MHNENSSVHVSEEEVSGGSKEGVVRWVLIIGTLLAIGALTIVWVTGAAFSDDTPEEEYISQSRQMQAEDAGDDNTLITPGSMGAQEEVVDGQPVITNPDTAEEGTDGDMAQ